MKKTLVEELLTQKIDEVFLECQTLRHITSGDISPLDAYHLELSVRSLAEHITKVLDYQTAQFNMCLTLEVLEDFHCFKRGEAVLAVDGDETHFEIQCGLGTVRVEREKCRVIGE